MTMFEPSQRTFWTETELDELTSSQEGSRVRTSALRVGRQEWGREQEAASGLKSSDLLASYHPASSSWRTSQTCLVALASGEGDGLAEFSETWPSAGMMRSGKTYRRRPWALPIAESAYGLWATPAKSDTGSARNPANFEWRGTCFYRRNGSKVQTNLSEQVKNIPRDFWPTPQKSDNRDRGNLSSPSVQRRKRIGKQLGLSQVVSDQSGALNPTWVEWLMGFPCGWTDLQD